MFHTVCAGVKLPEGESPVGGGHMELLSCLQYLLRAVSDYPLGCFDVMTVSGPRDVENKIAQ